MPGIWASDVLAESCDSPVSTDSSHSSAVRRQQTQVSRTTSPTRRMRLRPPGTSSVTLTCTGCPSRSTNDRWWICECSASTAFSDLYSLRKLRPMLIAMIAPMIKASVIAHQGRYDCSEEEQAEEVATDLTSQHREGADLARTQGVRSGQGGACPPPRSKGLSRQSRGLPEHRGGNAAAEARSSSCRVLGAPLFGCGRVGRPSRPSE